MPPLGDDDYIDYEKLEDDDDDDQSNNDDALPRSILDRRLVEASGALPSIFPPLLNPLHLQWCWWWWWHIYIYYHEVYWVSKKRKLKLLEPRWPAQSAVAGTPSYWNLNQTWTGLEIVFFGGFLLRLLREYLTPQLSILVKIFGLQQHSVSNFFWDTLYVCLFVCHHHNRRHHIILMV